MGKYSIIEICPLPCLIARGYYVTMMTHNYLWVWYLKIRGKPEHPMDYHHFPYENIAN
jgi:hypothetical protein